jgi:hypothetical protein
MLYETDAEDLIDFAKRWASLGDAVAEQVEQILDCPRVAAGLRDRAGLYSGSSHLEPAARPPRRRASGGR